MQRLWIAGALALTVFASAHAQTAPLTLERIMAEPDWIGSPVTNAYWGADDSSIYYQLKRSGSPIHDLHRIELNSGKDAIVDAGAMSTADGGASVYDAAGKQAAFIRNGDVFVRDLGNGTLRQITRTAQTESSPQFSLDGHKLSFRNGHDWFVVDLATGVVAAAATIKLEKDPDDRKPDDLRDLQLRWFTTLKRNHDDKHALRDYNDAMQKADPTRAPLPFYLGDDVQLVDTALSPDARWMLVVTSPKNFDEGKKGRLTRYVTESGYEEFEDERTRVGRGDFAPHALWLLDLASHTTTKLAFDTLTGFHDDPLKSVRDENAKQAPAKDADKKSKDVAADKSGKGDKGKIDEKTRGIQVAGIVFSRDGANAAIQLHANDNKDRWLATVDTVKHRLVQQHRLSDPAWINWNFNEFGWENDSKTLWYVSEESGYAHLYQKAIDGKAQALTSGKFEVSRPELSNDGRWFYVRSNAEAPYAYDVYRVAVGGGKLERITRYQGMEQFSLAHDDKRLLVTHSSSYTPSQISIVTIDGGAAHEWTDTRTADYKAMQWVAPEIVQVPSTHFKGSIYAKFYKPENYDKSKPHPAVVFVHGAGYVQNVHLQFPYYFREQMFHNLLLQKGYVVLDMDYRASEGYGRDWRDAIYRQMGHPELEDLLDGKQWLVQNFGVDPKRVGIYGGSYGGFMTLMALFRAPGEFAAGAALRPVTDWTQYNHDYTSDILNDPQIDPIAYQRSSPIEFAEGLKDQLLICHGVIDDNVLFEDSMRLYQRLIELHKDNFTISPYPLDRHGFVNADSWLDEYKRIYKLFDTTIGH